jgi:hypothetical protein
VFDHLRLSFSDPDKVGTAKNALERLWMSNANNFYIFCAKFVKLAGQAELPISQWKYELNKRFITQLRLQIIRDYLTKTVTFEIFK